MTKGIRISSSTWRRLQLLGSGFRGDALGTPDKVITMLLDQHDRATTNVTDAVVASAVRDATQAELALEPEGVLESLAAGELDATEATRHLAQAELDYRRERAAR